MSAYSRYYFKDTYVEKGDTVYCLSCTTASWQDHRPSTKSYSIQPYTVTAVGRLYLTAKPESGGRPVKFGHPPSSSACYGVYLEQENTEGMWKDKLFLRQEQAEYYRALLEKADAERAASGGGGQANADTQ